MACAVGSEASDAAESGVLRVFGVVSIVSRALSGDSERGPGKKRNKEGKCRGP
jgi:hypothetical protein